MESLNKSDCLKRPKLSVPVLLCVIVLVNISPCKLHPYADHMSGTSYIKQGDINIGGLFRIYVYNITEQNCSKPATIGDLKRVESMVYAINRINNNPDLLPNITLGFEIRDTCSSVAVTLWESLNFVTSRSLDISEQSCCAADSCSSNKTGILAGVVGTSRSYSSRQAAVVFGLYHLPQISYLATSDELSDSKTYPYFLRTVGADNFQVKAMIDIILQYKWDYISFLNSDDTYGNTAQQMFTILAAEKNICVGMIRTISLISQARDYDDVMKELLELQDESHTTVVIVFGHLNMVKGILSAATRKGAARRFIWIGADGWAIDEEEVIQGNEEAALGMYVRAQYVAKVQYESNSSPIRNIIVTYWAFATCYTYSNYSEIFIASETSADFSFYYEYASQCVPQIYTRDTRLRVPPREMVSSAMGLNLE